MIVGGEMKCGLQALKSLRHGLLKPAPLGYTAPQMCQNIASLHSELEQLIDGGNTELLMSEVEEANYSAALSLYQSLMAESPALSEEVMIAAIQKEYDLPNSLLASVLASNPQAAKSALVREALGEKSNPLDAYQQQLVALGYNSLSAKESKEINIGVLQANIELELLNRLCNAQATTDFINSLDPTNMAECLVMADMQYRSGQFSAGDTYLNNAAAMKHSQISQERIATYSSLMQLQYATNNGSQLTASDIAYLEATWQNNTDGFGKKANLLLHVYLGYPLDEMEPEVMDNRSALLETANVAKAAALKLWPNPSSALLQLQLVEPQPQNCELTILDLTGKLYHTQTIEKMQLEITLDVTTLPCNNYIVALRDANGVLITSSPFIKN